MKINLLPIGGRFEYEGQEYVKTGPLTASGPNGQRLIPRYAVLKPIETTSEPTKPSKATLDKTMTVQALTLFFQRCAPLIKEGHEAQYAALRDECLQQIKLKSR